MNESLPKIYCKVNPQGFLQGSVYFDAELNEVFLDEDDNVLYKSQINQYDEDQYDSFAVDGHSDKLTREFESKPPYFGSQEDSWIDFRNWFDSRVSRDAGAVTIYLGGGIMSGKSYFLFGSRDESRRGILPRWLEHVFRFSNTKLDSEQHSTILLQMSMTLIVEETLYDLLNPPQRSNSRDSLAFSKELGELILPLKALQFTNSSDAIRALIFGLDTLSVLSANEPVLLCRGSSHLLVQFRLLSSKGITRVTFVEGSGSPYQCDAQELDTLSDIGHKHRASTSLLAMSGVIQNNTEPIEGDAAGQNPEQLHSSPSSLARSSSLAYLLYESLFKHTDCYLVACLLGDRSRVSRVCNKQVLRFLTAIKEGTGPASQKLLPLRRRSLKEGSNGGYGDFILTFVPNIFTTHEGVQAEITDTLAQASSLEEVCMSKGILTAERIRYIRLLRDKANTLRMLAGGLGLYVACEVLLESKTTSPSPRINSPELQSTIGAVLRNHVASQRKGPVNPLPTSDSTLSPCVGPHRQLRIDWLQPKGEHTTTANKEEGVYLHILPSYSAVSDEFGSLLSVTIPSGLSKLVAFPFQTFRFQDNNDQYTAPESGNSKGSTEGSVSPPSRVIKIILDGVEDFRSEVSHALNETANANTRTSRHREGVEFCSFSNIGNELRVKPLIIEKVSGGGAQVPDIRLNGQELRLETPLHDGDFLCIGEARLIRVVIPLEREDEESDGGEQLSVDRSNGYDKDNNSYVSNNDPHRELGVNKTKNKYSKFGVPSHWVSAQNPWELGLVISYMKEITFLIKQWEIDRRHRAHQDISRELTAVAKYKDKSAVMNMKQFIPSEEEVMEELHSLDGRTAVKLCEYILQARLMNRWMRTLHRDMHVCVRIRPLHYGEEDGDLGVPEGVDQDPSVVIRLNGELASPLVHIEKVHVAQSSVPGPLTSPKLVEGRKDAGPSVTPEEGTEGPNADPGIGKFPVGIWWSMKKFENRFSLVQRQYESLRLHKWKEFESQLLANDQISSSNIEDDEAVTEVTKLLQENKLNSLLDIGYDPCYDIDPTCDILQDVLHSELVGVAFLYLDSIQYLVDIHEDNLPICSFQGTEIGSMGVGVRAWIDRVETAPDYVTVDKELHVRDFLSRTIILRFYFDNLHGLPAYLASFAGVRLQFECMFHQMRTPPLCMAWQRAHKLVSAWSTHTEVSILLPITPDLVSFLHSGSLEIEVWGQREPLTRPTGYRYEVGEDLDMFDNASTVDVVKRKGSEGDWEDDDEFPEIPEGTIIRGPLTGQPSPSDKIRLPTSISKSNLLLKMTSQSSIMSESDGSSTYRSASAPPSEGPSLLRGSSHQSLKSNREKSWRHKASNGGEMDEAKVIRLLKREGKGLRAKNTKLERQLAQLQSSLAEAQNERDLLRRKLEQREKDYEGKDSNSKSEITRLTTELQQLKTKIEEPQSKPLDSNALASGHGESKTCIVS